MVIWVSAGVGFSTRRSHPLLETAAVVLVAIVGWYLLQSPIAQRLPSGIVTNEESASAVIGGDIALVSPRSTVEVHSNDPRAPRVFIQRGQVTFDVVSGPGHGPFEAYSGDLVVSAADARFTMDCSAERSSISVARGLVDVEANGRIVRLTAGTRWPAASIPSRLRSPRPSAVAASR